MYPNTQPDFQQCVTCTSALCDIVVGPAAERPAAGQGGEIICQASLMASAPFQNLCTTTTTKGTWAQASLTYGAGMAAATEGSVANAVVASYMPSPSGFLDWTPQTAANMGVAENPLPTD